VPDWLSPCPMGASIAYDRECRWKQKKGACKVTSALSTTQFLRYLRDHLLLDKCVD